MNSTALELESLVRKLVTSWNERDEEAFAALFEADAEYVTGQGERLRGRPRIARLLREAEPGLRVASEAPSIDGDAGGATVWFRWTAARAGGPARQGRITCAVARKDGRWFIERLENEEDAP